MSGKGHDRFEIPKEMRSIAEESFEQARKAFDNFLASARQSAGVIEEQGTAVQTGAEQISSKAISYAEKNVQASLDYAQSLLHAKGLTDAVRLHNEFVQAQVRSFAKQASELGQAVRECFANSSTEVGIQDVKTFAYRVFGDDDKAEAWLHRPNASLSGQKPVELLTDELGAAVVREMLERIDHGIFA